MERGGGEGRGQKGEGGKREGGDKGAPYNIAPYFLCRQTVRGSNVPNHWQGAGGAVVRMRRGERERIKEGN